MNIELYSVRGFTGSALKQKLEEELRKLQLNYTVTEINNVDQFIKAELASVPAFKIGNKVIPHPDKAAVEETVQKVVTYVQDEYAPSILVPVDFSEESMNAMVYAEMLAQASGLGLTLVHIHKPIYDPVSAGALDVQFLHGSNKRLLEMVEKCNADLQDKGVSLHVSAHLEIGEPSTSLIELFELGQYEMMVIGTKAVDNTMRRLFGTVSSSVSRNATKPVIVVPASSEISFPNKIVVGFTEKLLLDHVLEKILAFGATQDVFYDFVHVTDDTSPFDALKTKLYDQLMVDDQPSCGFTIRPLTQGDHTVDEVLYDYAREAGAQLVAFVTHQRGFAEAFLHKSVTKHALARPELPVMILHQDS